ncbi:alpha/beta hydrolase [Streptomyces sp. NBC_00829]|uniref:alpha/beta hydrolase n=1 Tax=Streptomyces sp. NBC_00829 TaxID=2903679 RepID=UPI003870C2C5|nr:alpha/beta hydrolase [Streptomyces sp. NBC_00829]WTB18837.1 alpha/beta hydrolase [Streptomyces sp. NBC_00829]
MSMYEITFPSGKDHCSAWHLPGTGDAFAGAGGRPCVVMAPSFGGTRDGGLQAYAEGLATAGLDVVLFDYRGFGGSTGTPRQDVSFLRQRQDYHAAITAARRLPGIDPARIVLWGNSYAGGHVVAVAARDQHVAAVISMTPAMDGITVVRQLARNGGPLHLIRATVNGLRDALRAVTGRTPLLVPVGGEPGSNAIMVKRGLLPAYRAVAGPAWRNEVCARTALQVAFNRPIKFASRVSCPLLIQAGTHDQLVPPAPARRAAAKAGSRAQLVEYPIDHLDVYTGPAQAHALADQLTFLRHTLAPSPTRHQTSAPRHKEP